MRILNVKFFFVLTFSFAFFIMLLNRSVLGNKFFLLTTAVYSGIVILYIVERMLELKIKAGRKVKKKKQIFDIEKVKKKTLKDIEEEYNIPRWEPFESNKLGRSTSEYYQFLGAKEERKRKKKGMKILGIDEEFEYFDE